MTGSLRMRYSKLEEEQFRNLESRVKNVPRTFNIIGKLETRALSTKKPQRKTGITGSINRVARRKRARNVTLNIKMMRR